MEFRNFTSNGEVHPQQLTYNRNRISENVATNNGAMAEPTPAHDNGEDIGSYIKVANMQPNTRSTTTGEKWGSSFWKDCQPTTSRGASQSGEESEYKGSGGEVEEVPEGAQNVMEYEGDGIRLKGAAGKGHQAVPTDDMLSDEYFEQDGDDQSDSLDNHKAVNHSNRFSSKPPPRSTGPSSNFRKPKGLKTYTTMKSIMKKMTMKNLKMIQMTQTLILMMVLPPVGAGRSRFPIKATTHELQEMYL